MFFVNSVKKVNTHSDKIRVKDILHIYHALYHELLGCINDLNITACFNGANNISKIFFSLFGVSYLWIKT